MPDEPTSEERASAAEANIEFSPSATRAWFYANHGQTSISLFEIRLMLNFVLGVNPETNRLMIQNHLNLVLSPEMAAAVHRVLGNAIEAYKKQYGPLRQPELIGDAANAMGTVAEVPTMPPTQPQQS